MPYSEDWDRIRERLTAWWNHELDDPALLLMAPKAGVPFHGFNMWDFLKYHGTPDRLREELARYGEDTYFGGEALPGVFANLGPGSLAAMFSGYLEYDDAQQTAWFEKEHSWEAVEGMALQRSPWLAWTLEATEMALDAGEGRYVVGITDIGGILDVLASLRGAQNLLMDLLLEADRIHAMRRRILEAWHQVFDEVDGLIAPRQEGRSAWLGIWSPEPYYPLQCDFCAMISPDQFREFVLPDVEAQCRRLPKSIYHLDGPAEIVHLDMLLEIPELDGIQWVPGSGMPQCDSPRWFEMYEKILAKDKLLVLQSFDNPQRLPELMNALPDKGVLLHHWVGSEEEARNILRACGRD